MNFIHSIPLVISSGNVIIFKLICPCFQFHFPPPPHHPPDRETVFSDLAGSGLVNLPSAGIGKARLGRAVVEWEASIAEKTK